MEPRYYQAVWTQTNCPVCEADFGYRDKKTLFKAHCNECRATFWFYPGKEKPAVTMDADERRKHCGCGCGR